MQLFQMNFLLFELDFLDELPIFTDMTSACLSASIRAGLHHNVYAGMRSKIRYVPYSWEYLLRGTHLCIYSILPKSFSFLFTETAGNYINLIQTASGWLHWLRGFGTTDFLGHALVISNMTQGPNGKQFYVYSIAVNPLSTLWTEPDITLNFFFNNLLHNEKRELTS